MLAERYAPDRIEGHLISREEWRPFPPAAERAAWEDLLKHPLNRERRSYLVGQAEAVLELRDAAWPMLPATLYMGFTRTGNRSRYQDPYYTRRRNLASLVLAECFEHKGRFLDEIANGLWAITEEATWCVPAHARNQPDPLPSQHVEPVDLFNCETAMVLAEAHYLLDEELSALSPSLCERVRQQVLRRVVEQVETRDDFSWFSGFNNWTPWCASNVLGAAMYELEDTQRLAALAHKLMVVVDRFIDGYGPDGGCDEGPGYWGVAAGALLMFLELLHSRTGGAVNVYDEPLIGKMGRFIVDTHLSGPWFTNFADAPARLDLRRPVVYRYGERVGVDLMKDAALLAMRGWERDAPVYPPFGGRSGGALNHMLRELFWIPADAEPQGLPNDLVNWFPDLQVLVARESKTLGQGLVLAAKGGHNGESHNHNDLGQFIVMLDGQPAVVDVGVETYTRKTFSPERYTIWCIRSSGHNVPLVNGYEQLPGAEHRATDVAYASDREGERLGMNLEGAYPEEAGIQSLRREFAFSRDGNARVTVRDRFALSTGPVRIAIPLFTPLEVEQLAPGTLALASEPRRLLVRYDPESVATKVEAISIEDERLQASWGSHLNKVTLEYTSDAPAGEYSLEFVPEK